MDDETRYLQLLSHEYPTVQSAVSQIVYLKSLLALPKGTEYFFSDLHGEYAGFLRLLKSASGTIGDKIRQTFAGELSEREQNQLANLIYDPEEMLEVLRRYRGDSLADWKRKEISVLIRLSRVVARKYTREKVRRSLPEAYADIIDELMLADESDPDKKAYYRVMVDTIFEMGVEDDLIIALCHLIQELSVDKLHIIGDIFDRGPRADIIMNELMNFHNVDIEWGNHDISWMGAACGNRALIANVVRIALGYNNFDVLEDGYGINLRPLSLFAAEAYEDDPCERFLVHRLDENRYDVVDPLLTARMLKAITIIQLKLEGQLLERHPEYEMEDRKIFAHVDFEKGTVTLQGKTYPLADTNFPTVDPDDPLCLTDGEEKLMTALSASFAHSELLHRHIRFLYSHGSMYGIRNGNLMYHGCIPMEEDGSFTVVPVGNEKRSGKGYLDWLDEQVRLAYSLPEEDGRKEACVDRMWYLWCGKYSPVFGKSKMAMFESTFLDDSDVKEEIYNLYYRLSNREDICRKILTEFGLDPDHGHIINGHVPVRIKKGEKPVRGGGKLFMIDGGISKAYQTKTGIAGYTLISDSRHLALAEHKSYYDEETNASPITPTVQTVEKMDHRVLVADTDDGAEIMSQIVDLTELVKAYREGTIREQ